MSTLPPDSPSEASAQSSPERATVEVPPSDDPYGPPPAYEPPPAYGPPQAYAPPPAYGPPPGYGPSPAYGSPPTYSAPPPGYYPPGYGTPPGAQFGPPLIPGAAKPGIIPLRPLNLSDIFNGAVGYIRANPKPTLGLTAIVVVIMQVISLLLTIGPLTAANSFDSRNSTARLGALGAYTASLGGSALVGWLGGMLLSGMLTVVVGRAVFGSPITVGETWVKVRSRIPALLGLALLEGVGIAVIIGLVVVILVAVGVAANAAIAVLLGLPLLFLVFVLMAYSYTVLLFAPVLIVLERLSVLDAISRSFALVRNSFWRVLGIRLLAALVVGIIGGAISAPFTIVGEVMLIGASGTTALLVGTTLTTIGGAVSQIVTAPFVAGVVVLLYTDRRMRAEAFDLVLQTGALGGPTAAESTDSLWLTRPF